MKQLAFIARLPHADIAAPILFAFALFALRFADLGLLRVFAHHAPLFAAGVAPFIHGLVFKLVFWVLPAWAFLRWRGDTLRGVLLGDSLKRTLQWGFAFGGVLFGLNLAVNAFAFHPLPIGFSALNIYLLNPFIEELVFRAAILPTLARKLSFPWANTLTAALFVLVHVPGWLLHGNLAAMLLAPLGGALAIFALGWLFGWLAYRTNAVGAPMIAHALNNVSIPI